MTDLISTTVQLESIEEAFHMLWSATVGSPGYNKAEWIDFELLLNQIMV
jgi:hypothetical protein